VRGGQVEELLGLEVGKDVLCGKDRTTGKRWSLGQRQRKGYAKEQEKKEDRKRVGRRPGAE
jgi:hypothetical protein